MHNIKPRTVGAFLAYVLDIKAERARREVADYYMADALMHIAFNTARYSGGQYMTHGLYDILHPAPVSKRSADEIIEEVFKKIQGVI